MPTLFAKRHAGDAAAGTRPGVDDSRLLDPSRVSKGPPAVRVRENLVALELLLGRHGLENGRQQVVEKRRDLECPSELLVFVVGQGNFGKSSLINQVLGRDVAEVSVLPKTWRIDLYRGVGSGEPEFCLLRRAGARAFERLSIEGAKSACREQEEQIKKRGDLGPETELTTLPGQILEAHWYYAGLGLPSNIVLVDTPGYDQVRPGMNRADAKTLGGRNGLAYDLQEVYEEYYYRATLVLWAFKATQLNARKTIEVFEKLSVRGTEILGVLTCVDQVPEGQRAELLARARELYGSAVQEIAPVVAGGKGSELGLGIPDLRCRLAGIGPSAEAIKLAQADQFCRFLVQSGVSWLEGIGDTLIHNVTQVSLYCNATSERLLQETQCRYTELTGGYHSSLEKKLARLPSYTEALLNSLANHPSIRWTLFGVDEEQRRRLRGVFRDDVAKHLEIRELDQRLHVALERICGYVTAEGSRIASGYQMKQVVVRAAGDYVTRPLSARISPPRIDNLHISLPSFDVPAPPDGLWSGMLRLFGKASVSSASVAEATGNIIGALEKIKEYLLSCAREHTKAVAEAILESCDKGLAEVYSGKKLKDLKPVAKQIDCDLMKLHEIAGGAATGAGAHYRYETLFGIWSPRDDLRAAVIDLFCQWFEREWPQQRPETARWIESALAEHPLARKPVVRCIAAFLSRTKQYRESQPTDAGAIQGKPPQRPGVMDLLRGWRAAVHADLCRREPFSEQKFVANELKDIEYVKLSGIAQDFASHLADSFGARLDDKARLLPVPAARSSLGRRFDGVFAAVWLACLGLILSAMVHACGFPAVHSGFLQVIGEGADGLSAPRHAFEGHHMNFEIIVTMSSLEATALVYWLADKLWRRVRCTNLARQVAAGIHYEALCLAESTWRDVALSLDQATARKIVGLKTLTDKRPLDYAIEGAFDSYAG